MDVEEINKAVSNIMIDIFESTGGVEYFDLVLQSMAVVSLWNFAGLDCGILRTMIGNTLVMKMKVRKTERELSAILGAY